MEQKAHALPIVGVMADGRMMCEGVFEGLKSRLSEYTPDHEKSWEYTYFGVVNTGSSSKHYHLRTATAHMCMVVGEDVSQAVRSGIKLWLFWGKHGFDHSMPHLYPEADHQSVKDEVERVLNNQCREMGAAGETFVNTIANVGITGAYQRILGKQGASDHHNKYDGACGCGMYMGSAEDSPLTIVTEYHNSQMAKNKVHIVEKIIEAAKSIGLKVNGSTIEEQLKTLAKSIPQGGQFKADERVHTATCVGIAKAINQAFGNEVVDPKLPGEVICKQIAEILTSLTASIHTEFLTVLGDVRAVLQNLLTLRTAMDEIRGRVRTVSDTTDGVTKTQLLNLTDLHETVTNELNRQILMLKNLLNIHMLPKYKNLQDALKQNNLIAVIDSEVPVGSSKFGEVLSRVLKGLGTTASAAASVDKSLKHLGISIDEFARLKSSQELKEKILPGLMKDMDDKTTHAYLEAVDILLKNLGNSPAIVEEIKRKSGAGQCGCSGANESLDNIDDITGADEDVSSEEKQGAAEYPPSLMEKQVKDRKRMRTLIFSTFYRQLNGIFEGFAAALSIIASKVGTEISLSDQLDGFRDMLSNIQGNLGTTRKKDIYYALCGYYNDTMSRSKKDMFLMDLRMIDKYLASMIELPLYKNASKYFQDLRNVIANTISVIDKYSSEIEAKFGADEHTAVHGGDEDDFSQYNIKYKTTKSLTEAIREFDYRYRVAQIRVNLARAGKELSGYGANYEKLVAQSVANYVNKINTERYYAPKIGNTGLNLAELIRSNAKKFKEANKEFEEEKEANAAVQFASEQQKTRNAFWATVEAVDSYMQHFTNGIVNNPNDVKDIKAMLDDIEVISEWYNTNAGDELTRAFDCFADDKFKLGEGKHYYEKVVARSNTTVYPGSSSLPSKPSKGCDAREHVKKLFANMTALKNLLSVFVHVGAKFGGEELRKKVFMTPAQIYHNLVDYLACSALSQGTRKADDASILKDDKLVEFNYNWDIHVRKIGESAASTVAGSWDTEDQHFVLILKSIAAKIFTVVGTYDVFDRPHEYNGLSPIRMILGGSVDTPKVDEAAVALYLRLPLLCQFYRELFYLDDPLNNENPDNIYGTWSNQKDIPMNDNDKLKITMVPDLDGTFSGLIRLIFRKTKYVTDGNFTDAEVAEIIRECNSIYQKSAAKHSQNVILETINDLVTEVNRRYGVVTGKTRDQYQDTLFERSNYASALGMDRYSDDMPEASEYALLPGEEDEEIIKPSPSQRLLQDMPSTVNAKSSPYGVTLQYQQLMSKFKCRLDDELKKKDKKFSFNQTIKATQTKLRSETTDEGRFRLISRMIRGDGIYDQTDAHNYVMFHETVVSGLNVLSGIHTLLARFQRRAALLDLDKLEEIVCKIINDTSNALDWEKVVDGIWNNIVNAKLFNVDDKYHKHILYKVFGYGERFMWNGGTQPWSVPTEAQLTVGVTPVDRFGAVNKQGTDVTGGKGLATLLNRIPTANLNNLRKGVGDKDQVKKVRAFFAHLFSHEFVMKELLEALYGLSGDMQNMVTVRIDDMSLHVSFADLKSDIESMFDSVKRQIEVLKPRLPKELIEKHLDKLTAGSYYWLEENLMEKIIVGQEVKAGQKYDTLEETFRNLTKTWKRLTCEHSNIAEAGGTVTTEDGQVRHSFNNIFNEMIYYRSDVEGRGLTVSKKAPDVKNNYIANTPPAVVDFLNNPYEMLHQQGPPNAKILDTKTSVRFKQLYSFDDELTMNRSCLFMFNQLIAKYIQAFYDPASQKMYSGLISQFANGVFNRAISDTKYTFKDVIDAQAGILRDGTKTLVSWNNIYEVKPELYKAATELEIFHEWLFTIKAGTDNIAYNDVLPHYTNTDSALTFNTARANVAPVNKAMCGFLRELLVEIVALEYVKQSNIVNAAAAPAAGAQAKLDAISMSVQSPIITDLYTARLSITDAMISNSFTLDRSGKVSESANAPLNYKFNAGLMDVYNKILDTATNLGKITSAVLTSFPFASDMDGNNEIKAIKRQMFSAYLAGVTSSADDVGTIAAKLAKKDSRAFLLSAVSEKQGHIIKQDDFVDVGDVMYDKTSLSNRATIYANATDKNFVSEDKDIDGDHVLFTSLSIILRTIVTTRVTSTQMFVNLLENVADIPEYLKEKMRANLPAFRNMFDELRCRCEFIKTYMNRDEISLTNKTKNNGILDAIIRGVSTLRTACETVLKEIGSDIKYFETCKNSIRDYKQMYGYEPFMPLSSVLAVLKNVNRDTQCNFLPIHSIGTPQFKYMYGTTEILQEMKKHHLYDNNLGFKACVESFNMLSDTQFQYTKQNAEAYLKVFTRLTRYIYNTKHIKGMITSYTLVNDNKDYTNINEVLSKNDNHFDCIGGSYVRDDMVVDKNQRGLNNILRQTTSVDNSMYGLHVVGITNKSDISMIIDGAASKITVSSVEYDAKYIKPAFALSNTLDRLLQLSESSRKDEQIACIAKHVSNEKINCSQRKVIQNIIDLNIVPINVHALMREIPLANLYNYGYTFDQMILELLGINHKKGIEYMCGDNSGFESNNSLEVMVKLLLHPYSDVANENANVIEMLSGLPLAGELGRPKFLSDQVYGKAIFGDLFKDGDNSEVTRALGPVSNLYEPTKNATLVLVSTILREMIVGGNKLGKDNAETITTYLLNNQTASTIDIMAQPWASKPTTTDQVLMVALLAGIPTIWAVGQFLLGVDKKRIKSVIDVISTKLHDVEAKNTLDALKNLNNGIKEERIVRELLEPRINNPKNITGAAKLPDLTNLWAHITKVIDDVNARKEFQKRHDRTTIKSLTYIPDGETTIKTISFDDGTSNALLAVGRTRLDSVLTRNIIFIVNLYRICRYKLQKDLMYSKDIIMSSTPITRPDLTEFLGNQAYQDRLGADKARRTYNR